MAKCFYNLNVSSTLATTLGVVNSIQGMFASFGNILVFLIVLGNKRLRTRSNLFLLSLATTDLLVGILVEPMHVMQFFSVEYRNNCSLNKIRRYFSTVFMGASISSIVAISYDRYLHLSKTMNYKTYMTRRKVALLLTICWLIPLLIPFVRYTSETVYSAIILIYVTVVIVAMITCYVVIIKIIKRRVKSLMEGESTGTFQKQIVKRHIKVSKAIAIVIACLLATFVPISVFHGVTAIYGLASKSSYLSAEKKEICYAVLMTFALANSAMNPAIYYLRIPEFRNTLKSGIRRLLGSPKKDYSVTNSNENKSSDTAI